MSDQPTPSLRLWAKPFMARTWRRTTYLVLVAPISLVALVLVAIGQPTAGARAQERLDRFGLERPFAAYPSTDRLYGMSSAASALVLGCVSFVVVVYGWLLVVLNLGYPLRGDLDLSDAWGGPSLAGAWAVHAAGGLVFLFVVPWVVDGLVVAHKRIARGVS